MVLLGDEALERYFAARLGVEPLGPDFTTAALRALAVGRRAPVKAFLLSQERIAGVGNIYADEALWRARIHPLRAAGELTRAEVAELRKAVRKALEVGIARQGATLRDYRDPNGRGGRMQLEFLVYGRGGEPCERCGVPIEKIRAAGRGTWYCPSCQRRDGAAATPRSAPGHRSGRAARAR